MGCAPWGRAGACGTSRLARRAMAREWRGFRPTTVIRGRLEHAWHRKTKPTTSRRGRKTSSLQHGAMGAGTDTEPLSLLRDDGADDHQDGSMASGLGKLQSHLRVTTSPANADPVGGNPAAWRGPHRERSGPPPRLAVEGRSSGHGPMLPISDVDKVKPMLLPHRGGPWPRAPPRAWAPLSPGRKQGCGSHHT